MEGKAEVSASYEWEKPISQASSNAAAAAKEPPPQGGGLSRAQLDAAASEKSKAAVFTSTGGGRILLRLQADRRLPKKPGSVRRAVKTKGFKHRNRLFLLLFQDFRYNKKHPIQGCSG